MIGIYVFGYTKNQTYVWYIYIFMFAHKNWLLLLSTVHMFSQKQIKLHRYLITFFSFIM